MKTPGDYVIDVRAKKLREIDCRMLSAIGRVFAMAVFVAGEDGRASIDAGAEFIREAFPGTTVRVRLAK